MAIYHSNLLSTSARQIIINEIQNLVLPCVPFFIPTTKSGKSFHYQMTCMGECGWVSDQQGYRYQLTHPFTHKPWAKMIPSIANILIPYLKFQGLILNNYQAQTCLINKYEKGSKLGLHQDKDETNKIAPLISISLGADGIFQLGGLTYNDPLQEIILKSGDVLILSEKDRMRYHGIKGIINGDKRLNLTIRQVD